jgi:hypothetical protein
MEDPAAERKAALAEQTQKGGLKRYLEGHGLQNRFLPVSARFLRAAGPIPG